MNLVGNLVPEFSEVLERLRKVTTKYETLMSRLNPQGPPSTISATHGSKIRELLLNDKFARKIKLVDDFSTGRQGGWQSSSVSKAVAHGGNHPSDVEDLANKERQKQIFEQNN